MGNDQCSYYWIAELGCVASIWATKVCNSYLGLVEKGVYPGFPTSGHVIYGLFTEKQRGTGPQQTLSITAQPWNDCCFWSSIETHSNNTKKLFSNRRRKEENEGTWAVSEPTPISLNFRVGRILSTCPDPLIFFTETKQITTLIQLSLKSNFLPQR